MSHAGATKAETFPAHVLITGASSGLGWALALQYAAAGKRLSLAGRDVERLAVLRDECARRGAQAEVASLDVTDADAMSRWLIGQDRKWPVELLIANAGIGGKAALAPEGGERGLQARAILDVNTIGLINTVTPLLGRMRARGWGHIVMVGSIQGAIGLPQSPVYSASKAAVKIYADGVRRLVRRDGLLVTVVLPGFIDTPMSRSLQMPRPFCWPADKAARRIVSDVARGARYSVFPLPLRLAIGLGKVLPAALSDIILARSLRYHRWPEEDAAEQGDEGATGHARPDEADPARKG